MEFTATFGFDLDVARGPDDTALYVQLGRAWQVVSADKNLNLGIDIGFSGGEQEV